MIDHLLPIHGNVLVIEPACKAGIVRPKPSMVFRPVIERGSVLIHPESSLPFYASRLSRKTFSSPKPVQLGADYPSDPNIPITGFQVRLGIVGLFSCPSSCRIVVLGFCILSSVRAGVVLRFSPSALFHDGSGRRQTRVTV